MNSKTYAFLQIAVMALVTALIRFLPFLLFKNRQRRPALISYLGRVLPYAMMGMLVVYCLKAIQIQTYPHGLPELIALIVVVLLHLWKRNSLLSIFGGTAVYMLLVQLVFV